MHAAPFSSNDYDAGHTEFEQVSSTMTYLLQVPSAIAVAATKLILARGCKTPACILAAAARGM